MFPVIPASGAFSSSDPSSEFIAKNDGGSRHLGLWRFRWNAANRRGSVCGAEYALLKP